MPTQQEIDNLKRLILESFYLLCSRDSDLVYLGDSEVLEIYADAEKMERKLHEVCINHRLAFYLEALLTKYFSNDYKVDIEYNRYYKNPKVIHIDNEYQIARPDIIIHTRTNITTSPQHLLVVEAKKDILSKKDTSKVKAFIEDKHYQYLFGLTVKYNDFNPIEAKLYYKDKFNNIVNEDIIYKL